MRAGDGLFDHGLSLIDVSMLHAGDEPLPAARDAAKQAEGGAAVAAKAPPKPIKKPLAAVPAPDAPAAAPAAPESMLH